MKDYELLDAFGGIERRFVEAAEKSGRKKRAVWKAAAPLAACVALLVGAYAVLPKTSSSAAPRPTPDPDPGGLAEYRGEPAVYPSPVILRPGDGGDAAPEPAPAPNPEQAAEGIFIPAIELPESNAHTDMDGLVVYRGGIYTQAEWYRGEDAERVEGLVGEYLGHASGRLDEWSTQEDYAAEFASVLPGDVYTVKGYDPGFRLCIPEEYTDEDGTPVRNLCFYERLNGIALAAGEDLYEDRLHVRGRVASIQWQTHEDWDWSRGNHREASVSREDWDAFLDALDRSGFIDAWIPDGSFYEDRPGSRIYDTPNQTHLFLNMDDGTRIELLLIEGGYVRYSVLGGGWYFVEMPGDAFDAVFDACGGTHVEGWQ